MDARKRKRLEAAGWRVGTAEEFLGLPVDDSIYGALKMALGKELKRRRLEMQWTQGDLAHVLGSSQARVARMEAGDASVSIDLVLKALLTLGATRKEVAKAIA
jgi:DNA-binding XRE family transcriptional regulator